MVHSPEFELPTGRGAKTRTTVPVDLDRHRFRLGAAKNGEGTYRTLPPQATDAIKPGAAAIRICGCQFLASTRSAYSATNSLVVWVR
jgi:hypothetical protein